MNLTDRVAIVTGASGGLGKSICRTFTERGARVVPVDVTGDDVFIADVGSDGGNRAMIDHALELHGRLDALVLNAGVQHVSPLESFPEDQWDRLMNVMVKGPFLAMRTAWPHLTARPGGRIVVTASGSSYIGEANKAAYVAAKHAVLGLVKVAAIEGGPAGLTANAVAPGWMRTPMVENQVEEQMRLRGLDRQGVLDLMLERSPVKRFVETDEAANLIAFLAGPESSGLNGTCTPVDLGLLSN
ncbi:SDR family NAD(P)-dependent oxidoreductase [Cryptosporangium sp. NPDC051539]|uniref:SDR family NAD(P)-dependent oxidoreductase n=1 Tax=Cryptosporangium sp. NPDC051539 TaxID=3363962 RepID=UPI0037927013